MSWNYRMVRHRNPVGEEALQIAEVYYDDAGKPNGWCEATPHGEDLAEMKLDFALMIEAMDKPILDVDEEGNIRASEAPDGNSKA